MRRETGKCQACEENTVLPLGTVDFWKMSPHATCFWVPAVPGFDALVSVMLQVVMILTAHGQPSLLPLTNYIHQDFQGQDQYIHRLVVELELA